MTDFDPSESLTDLYFLHELAKLFSSSIDLEEVLDYVTDGVCGLLGTEASFVYLADHAGDLHPRIVRALPRDEETLQHLKALSARVVRTQSPVTVAYDTPPKGLALLAVPLVARDEVQGVLGLATRTPRTFTPREVSRLATIGNLASLAVENARLFAAVQRELDAARTIQQSFLPDESPRVPGYDLAAVTIPARQVGGDFYDFIPLPDGRWGLVVADVSDKGAPAALFMALSRSLLRVYAAGGALSPLETLRRTNRFILDNTRSSGMFVTLFYGVLDPATCTLTYVNAGHNPPILCTAQACTTLPTEGAALGVFEDVSLQQRELSLPLSDTLLLYTDGVTEAINKARERFGMDRLAACLRTQGNGPAQAFLDAVLADVARFVGDEPTFDDLTLMVVRGVRGDVVTLPPAVPARAYTLRVPSQIDRLPVVCAFVQEVFESLGLPAPARYEILTAVDEAVTNVIKHAYGESDEGEFALHIWREGERVVLSIRHRGYPPDLRQISPPDLTSDLEHRRVGGLGIYLMQQLMDEVHFLSYEDGSSETRLVKWVE